MWCCLTILVSLTFWWPDVCDSGTGLNRYLQTCFICDTYICEMKSKELSQMRTVLNPVNHYQFYAWYSNLYDSPDSFQYFKHVLQHYNENYCPYYDRTRVKMYIIILAVCEVLYVMEILFPYANMVFPCIVCLYFLNKWFLISITKA